jgi:hypothetical protein
MNIQRDEAFILRSCLILHDIPLFIFLFKLDTLSIRTRILLAQNILLSDHEDKQEIIDQLLDWMLNNKDDNTRADIADLFIHGNVCKHEAEETLEALGRSSRSIYKHQQNVHKSSIQASSKSLLEVIVKHAVESKRSWNEIKSHILQCNDAIECVLDRIENDRIQIPLSNTSESLQYYLRDIFTAVVNYIDTQPTSDLLFRRLIDEMIDMKDTCTTGYFVRLANLFSGIEHEYNYLTITIDWSEQISANLLAAIERKIRIDPKGEDIMVELASSNIQDTPHLARFIQQHISALRDELYIEFKEHIEEQEFDLYFIRALTNYQSVI